jgi:hypothetical protein
MSAQVLSQYMVKKPLESVSSTDSGSRSARGLGGGAVFSNWLLPSHQMPEDMQRLAQQDEHRPQL